MTSMLDSVRGTAAELRPQGMSNPTRAVSAQQGLEVSRHVRRGDTPMGDR
jgi:hypothetical protein